MFASPWGPLGGLLGASWKPLGARAAGVGHRGSYWYDREVFVLQALWGLWERKGALGGACRMPLGPPGAS